MTTITTGVEVVKKIARDSKTAAEIQTLCWPEDDPAIRRKVVFVGVSAVVMAVAKGAMMAFM